MIDSLRDMPAALIIPADPATADCSGEPGVVSPGDSLIHSIGMYVPRYATCEIRAGRTISRTSQG